MKKEIMKRNKKRKISKQTRKPSRRVFSWLLNKAAFVDTIVLSVDGDLKETFEDELVEPESKGTFRPGVLYSRRVSGTFWPSGNPVLIQYGRTRRFKNVSTLRIAGRSERIPLTGAQVALVIKRLTVGPTTVRVSSVEFTFDFTNHTIGYVLRHMIHRAQRDARVLSDGRRRTIYVGSRRSAWQVCVYQKTHSVVRLEFILRRPFLARHGVNRPEDIVLLRRLKVWDLLSIRRFSASSAARVTRTWENALGRELVLTWAYYKRELRAIIGFLRGHEVHPHRVLRRTGLQRQLEAMQRRFVW